MAKPGALYAHDEDGAPCYFDAIRPPDGWVWCPGSHHFRQLFGERVEPHYKPNDGARCLECGYEPKKQE